jgi:hypothetical protein
MNGFQFAHPIPDAIGLGMALQISAACGFMKYVSSGHRVRMTLFWG